MDGSFKEIMDTLSEYEDILKQDKDSELSIADIEGKLKSYFNKGSSLDKMLEAEFAIEKLTKIIALLDTKMHDIKTIAQVNSRGWGNQKKYLETLQLQKKEPWNS